MDGYTFDEGVAILILMKTPVGVVSHLKAIHNRDRLHAEIHRQLRTPACREILRKEGYYREEPAAPAPLIAGNDPQSPNGEDGSEELPESDEITPKSNTTETSDPPKTGTGAKDNVPENDNSGTNDADGGADPAEIILTKEDVRKHENTRLEDMPNELCRTLWLKRQDAYREAQQAHLKMRNVPEGEAHNEERAKWRAKILRLLDVVNDYWKQIDEEIARFNSQVPEPVEGPAKETPAFNVSTYRAYISKALRKKSLTPAQLAELQHRVDAMIQAGVEIEGETLEKLKGVGVSIG